MLEMNDSIFMQNGYCKTGDVIKFNIKFNKVVGIIPNHDMLTTTGFIASSDGYWVAIGVL